jgi:hypothetical protein
MGMFPFLWENEDACPRVKGNVSNNIREVPLFIGIFPFLWEYSHFYEKLKKACHLVKGNVSTINEKLPFL